jgi:hypothetical protein
LIRGIRTCFVPGVTFAIPWNLPKPETIKMVY